MEWCTFRFTASGLPVQVELEQSGAALLQPPGLFCSHLSIPAYGSYSDCVRMLVNLFSSEHMEISSQNPQHQVKVA